LKIIVRGEQKRKREGGGRRVAEGIEPKTTQGRWERLEGKK